MLNIDGIEDWAAASTVIHQSTDCTVICRNFLIFCNPLDSLSHLVIKRFPYEMVQSFLTTLVLLDIFLHLSDLQILLLDFHISFLNFFSYYSFSFVAGPVYSILFSRHSFDLLSEFENCFIFKRKFYLKIKILSCCLELIPTIQSNFTQTRAELKIDSKLNKFLMLAEHVCLLSSNGMIKGLRNASSYVLREVIMNWNRIMLYWKSWVMLLTIKWLHLDSKLKL